MKQHYEIIVPILIRTVIETIALFLLFMMIQLVIWLGTISSQLLWGQQVTGSADVLLSQLGINFTFLSIIQLTLLVWLIVASSILFITSTLRIVAMNRQKATAGE